jgi:hypothetical protein
LTAFQIAAFPLFDRILIYRSQRPQPNYVKLLHIVRQTVFEHQTFKCFNTIFALGTEIRFSPAPIDRAVFSLPAPGSPCPIKPLSENLIHQLFPKTAGLKIHPTEKLVRNERRRRTTKHFTIYPMAATVMALCDVLISPRRAPTGPRFICPVRWGLDEIFRRKRELEEKSYAKEFRY